MKKIALAVIVSLIGVPALDSGRAEPMAANLIRDFGQKNYLRLSRDLPHSEDKTWKLICSLPYNCHFQPWIEVEAEAGKEIRFNSTNPLVLYLTPTETHTTKAGVQQVEAKNWVSGEGAMYTIPAGVKVLAVKYRETGYDTTFAGSFECNDNDYNVLWTKAVRTAYICMRDHFYDCPDRERVGFWGDGTPELNQCFYAFDSKSHQLCKELVLRKLEPKFYPGQHLEFLGDYGLWFYYLHTGDLESLRKIYPQTKTFLFDIYQFGNRGTWFDWGKENKDTAVIETCFYYNCLGTLKKMAEITGNKADIPAINKKMNEISSTFDSKYWKGTFYMSGQVKVPDDRANAMAVNVGLADKSKWPLIYENVLTKKTFSSCFFDRWVFEALCRMGKEEQALMRMYTRYKTMIPCTFTTLWEHYDRWWASRIDAYDDASSLNHGWNPPALILSQTIAGVAPIEPGWNTFKVMPQEAFLKSIKMTVPTIKGNITVELNKNEKEYGLVVVVPPNTRAVLGIPKGSFSTLEDVQAGGVTIWKKEFKGGIKGLAWIGDKDGYLQFKVEPGTWKLTAHGSLPIRSPKPVGVAIKPTQAIDPKGWIASASVPDSTFPFSGAKIPVDVSAANAIDGDHWTGWRDMTKKQYPGQWFQVDMGKEQSFSRIVLDNTWALWDSPVGYSVTVSSDGKTWSEPIAKGAGELGITTISFTPQKARFLRITQTGTSSRYNWSIYELKVYDR